MMVLIIGSPGSGKSALAEEETLKLSPEGRRIYIATMIPFGEEGQSRIKKHRRMRDGKGFETLECYRDLKKLKDLSGATCLLECMSNLVGNEMHAKENTGRTPEELCRIICEETAFVKESAENLVVVSNEFAPEEGFYDDETRSYIALNHQVNQRLKYMADLIYRKEKEAWIIEKTL